jgi:UDP-glucose 4-epimerase
MATDTVLVTGGAGYIGSHVVLELLDAGYRPVVLDNLSTGFRSAVPANVTFVEGDVLDGGLLADLLAQNDVQAIIHLAASIRVDESVAEPLKYYRNNTVVTLQLIDAAIAAGVDRFVFSSTAAVYGALETSPASEDAPTRPINPYGSSKHMCEVILRDVAAAQPQFRPVCLRYFNVAGADPAARAGGIGPASHLIRVAAEAALGLRPQMEVYGQDYPTRDGTCERDYVHVTDIATAHVAALRYLEGGGAPVVLNCGTGHGRTVLEVLTALEEVTGRKLPVGMAPRRAGDPPSLVADASRIREVFDWRAEHSDLETILRSELAWREKSKAKQAE